jgi:hypothetical protein
MIETLQVAMEAQTVVQRCKNILAQEVRCCDTTTIITESGAGLILQMTTLLYGFLETMAQIDLLVEFQKLPPQSWHPVCIQTLRLSLLVAEEKARPSKVAPHCILIGSPATMLFEELSFLCQGERQEEFVSSTAQSTRHPTGGSITSRPSTACPA